MKSLGKRQKLQKRGKLLISAKEPEHVQRVLDETRLAERKKWQKHLVADVISVQEAARLVSEGAEEIGTQLSRLIEMRRFESNQSKLVRQSLWATKRKGSCVVTVRRQMPKEFISSSVLRVPGKQK